MMNEFNRRLGDGDFHVVEEIIMDDSHAIVHRAVPEQKKPSFCPEMKELLGNIEANEGYYTQGVSYVNEENVEKGDIIEIKFVKNYKQKEHSIVLRFFIKMRYSTSVLGYIHILDESNGFCSKARGEKIALPIIQGGKRKMILTESLQEAIIVSTSPFLHESRIQEITVYKKGEKRQGITGFFKEKIGALLKKK